MRERKTEAMECLIHLKSRSSEEPEGQELWVSGTCYEKKPGIFQILYESREDLDGNAPELLTKNRLKLEPECLTVVRYGPTGSTLVFGPGRTEDSLYRTPFGELVLTFRTVEFRREVREDGVTVRLRYEILTGAERISENTMEIAVSFQA